MYNKSTMSQIIRNQGLKWLGHVSRLKGNKRLVTRGEREVKERHDYIDLICEFQDI